MLLLKNTFKFLLLLYNYPILKYNVMKYFAKFRTLILDKIISMYTSFQSEIWQRVKEQTRIIVRIGRMRIFQFFVRPAWEIILISGNIINRIIFIDNC